MRKAIIILLVGSYILPVTGCTSRKNANIPENWSEQQINEWLDQTAWLSQTDLQPHPSIDKKKLVVRYYQHKDRWDKAFSFLKKENLLTIEEGTHEIDGRDVFAVVSAYESKNHEDVPYEVHEKYADIQYVTSGIEYIGLADLSAASPTTPYSEERDIAFYGEVRNGQHLLAEPGTFFIFFPGMGHSPGRKVEDNVPVKKIVIKVKS